MWDTLLEIGTITLSYGAALLLALAVGWTLAKIFKDGPFPLRIALALALFGLLVIGPIVGIWQGSQNQGPTYYDEVPNPEFDRYS